MKYLSVLSLSLIAVSALPQDGKSNRVRFGQIYELTCFKGGSGLGGKGWGGGKDNPRKAEFKQKAVKFASCFFGAPEGGATAPASNAPVSLPPQLASILGDFKFDPYLANKFSACKAKVGGITNKGPEAVSEEGMFDE
jgi:hypothetical protein